MEYLEKIKAFQPENEQEASDRRLIVQYAEQFPDTVLLRENEIAHMTSSALILNRSLDRALMVHHNIRDCWSWTGGHADGDTDLLAVALREAKEETGAQRIMPLTDKIVSVEILTIYGHLRRDRYVSAHLHLNASYLLLCDEGDTLCVKADENSAVRWFGLEEIRAPLFGQRDVALYQKLIQKAARVRGWLS